MLMLLSILKIKNYYCEMISKIPMSSNLTYFWSFGFILGVFLLMQTLSGFLITFTFIPTELKSFHSVFFLQNEIYFGWLLYSVHSLGVSFIFIIMYVHIFRGFYYKLFNNFMMWVSGMIMFLMLIIISFLGYVLPWNQMSYWAAKVITSMITVVYYLGNDLILLLWGDFTVSGPTLQRFFTLHFILPLLLWVMILTHLLILHIKVSSNPFGSNSSMYSIPFFPYYLYKDIFGCLIIMFIMMYAMFFNPFMFLESDSFIPSNKLVTPNHIKPDWFLLWAYAVLRSISSKVGGIICLLCIFVAMFMLKYLSNMYNNTMNIYLFWDFVFVCFLLSYCGGAMLEYPFTELSKIMIFVFYVYLLFLPNF